jgi:type II secretion system protein N
MTAEAAAANEVERGAQGARAIVARMLGGTAGRGGSLLGYALFTLLLFLVCFVLTFPHDLLLQRALVGATAGLPIRVETGTGSLGWSLAYGLDALKVRARDGDAEPYLAASAVRVAPSRLGLLRGNPFPVGIDAALYGGTLRGWIDPRPATFAVNATLAEVDLARYTGLRPWLDGTLRGHLEGNVTLDGGGRGPAAASGDVHLRIPGLALEGTKIRGITVPDLHFTDVHANGTVKNGRMEIEELVADGQELTLRGQGNLLVREPFTASVLNLDLTVTPAAGAPEGLRLMMNMLPGTSAEGGARRVGVVGTIGRPTFR